MNITAASWPDGGRQAEEGRLLDPQGAVKEGVAGVAVPVIRRAGHGHGVDPEVRRGMDLRRQWREGVVEQRRHYRQHGQGEGDAEQADEGEER
jgi:hypothetical protein